jgi:hypothetical protein
MHGMEHTNTHKESMLVKIFPKVIPVRRHTSIKYKCQHKFSGRKVSEIQQSGILVVTDFKILYFTHRCSIAHAYVH